MLIIENKTVEDTFIKDFFVNYDKLHNCVIIDNLCEIKMLFGENRDEYYSYYVSYFEVHTECVEYKKYYILENLSTTQRVLYLKVDLNPFMILLLLKSSLLLLEVTNWRTHDNLF